MAIVTTDDKHYKNIAQAIRDKTGGNAQYKPGEMADGVGEVYDAGYAKGQAEGGGGGYDEGYEAGQQAEYDRFWDAFQHNGNRSDYSTAFAGVGWNDVTYKPKYSIRPQNAERMFNVCDIKNIVTNGVIDFSAVTKANYFLMNTTTESIDLVDLSNVSGSALSVFFNSQALHTIGKLVVNGNITFGTWFNGCSALENVTFEGTIGSGIALAQSSKLTNVSVQSIIDHLKDLTGATAQTLTFHATVGEKLTDAQKATITAKNWQLVY